MSYQSVLIWVLVLGFTSVSLSLAVLKKQIAEQCELLRMYLAGEVEYEDFSDVQEHVAQREQRFDERIKQLKQELNQGTEAVELHPDVKNLPHESITQAQTNPPKEEYSI